MVNPAFNISSFFAERLHFSTHLTDIFLYLCNKVNFIIIPPIHNALIRWCFLLLSFSLRVPCWQTPFIVLMDDLGSRPSPSHLTNKDVISGLLYFYYSDR